MNLWQLKKSSSEVWSVNFFVGLVVEDNESICLTIDTLPTMKSFQHFNANSQDLGKHGKFGYFLEKPKEIIKKLRKGRD